MGKNEKVIKTAGSFEGWSFIEFVKGYLHIIKDNWGTLKEIGKILAPLILSAIATKNPAWVAGVTVVGKALLDIAEYFFKEKKA